MSCVIITQKRKQKILWGKQDHIPEDPTLIIF